MLNDDYLEEMQGHPNYKEPYRLNQTNDNVLNIYQILNSNFGNKTPGFFEFVISAFYDKLDKFEAQYMSIAFAQIDNSVTVYQIKQQEKQKYLQDSKKLINKGH